MKPLFDAPAALFLFAISVLPFCICAANGQTPEQAPVTVVWQSTKAQHVYGLPDIKRNKKGTLTLSHDALTFTGSSGNASISRNAVTAVSAGNQRVELFGKAGMFLRMTIPDGGGVAAAAVMHHRVDLLTVEFNDDRGGKRSAVFLLPAREADRAIQDFTVTPPAPRQTPETACAESAVEPQSVLVAAPNWDRADVPAAYRALVYEHLVDRLRSTKGVGRVYRDSEDHGHGGCAQYTIHISIATFKEGSSVKRAAFGPIGFFVGTTQMKLDVTFTDAAGRLQTSQEIQATMRGESESTNVADHVAKSVAKKYAAVLKDLAERSSHQSPVNRMS